jgi:hypothetical protein
MTGFPQAVVPQNVSALISMRTPGGFAIAQSVFYCPFAASQIISRLKANISVGKIYRIPKFIRLVRRILMCYFLPS